MQIKIILLFITFTHVTCTTNLTVPVANIQRWKYFLSACAMIRNEMSVILEWIEFHRIQGVEHFIFYDDESTDDTYLLPRLFSDLGYPDLVEIYPVNFRRFSQPSGRQYSDHDKGQWQGLNHCNTRMTNVSQWLLISDVDEFMFSPKFGTIATYLQNRTKEDTREINVPVIRFGTSGVLKENRVRLAVDPYSDNITVITEMFNDDLLLTSRNSNRGPFPGLDKDFKKRYREICASTKRSHECDHAIGKSIWRPDKCGLAGVHNCEKVLSGHALVPSVEELRINHYAFRSKEHMDNHPKHQMGAIKGSVYRNFDQTWFSSVEDSSIDRYTNELLDRLDGFPNAIIDLADVQDAK